MQTKIVRCLNLDEELLDELICLWKNSVVATHHFLKDRDIEMLVSSVELGLKEVEVLLLSYTDKTLSGFVGIYQEKIEMLFVHPLFFRKGIGKQLMNRAINEHRAIYVDVNEQNEEALNFYKHIGFNLYERQELDDYGNPFPILKMRLE